LNFDTFRAYDKMKNSSTLKLAIEPDDKSERKPAMLVSSNYFCFLGQFSAPLEFLLVDLRDSEPKSERTSLFSLCFRRSNSDGAYRKRQMHPPPLTRQNACVSFSDPDSLQLGSLEPWTGLGVPTPRQIRLTPAARSRLAHLVELNDVSSPSDAERWAGQLAQEPHILIDLMRVRPWLTPVPPGTRRDTLTAVLTEIMGREWTGFLVLLGEYGPWVYAPSVADLQELSRHYAALVTAASSASEQIVLDAAQQLQQVGTPHVSLLARLEATNYRQPQPRMPEPSSAQLVGLELAFWNAAEAQARRRVEEREREKR
jgi:hypothetical protein